MMWSQFAASSQFILSCSSPSRVNPEFAATGGSLPYGLLRGTLTVTVDVDWFPDGSVHTTVIVYTRPFPVPERSARRFTVRAPVITQSGLVSPSPRPSAGSLLVTATIRHDTAAPQPSAAATCTTTRTI